MTLLKYADDMALVAHLTDNNARSKYHQAVNNLVQTFRGSSLELNIIKTRELCCGSREKPSSQQPLLFQSISIDGQLVEQVQSFKYIGTEIDTSLSFSQNIYAVYKKAQQHLHLPRKLRTFNFSKDILTQVYRSLI